MRNIYPLAGLLSLLASPLAAAQQLAETRYGATTTNVYAQQQINLLAGPGPNDSFEASSGFEARIRLPEDVAGRWSAPLPWTTYIRPATEGGNGAEGLVGIHTNVLPNGHVFSWEGHNNDTFASGLSSCTSHAYSWNPNPSARVGATTYPQLYYHYDLDNINIFCGGHTFLTDGRLLSAGGHYSGGQIIRNSAINNTNNLDYIPGNGDVNGYIGTRDLNIFDYKTPPNTLGNSGWQTSASFAVPAMTYRRWYPTATTLADGRVLVVAGQRYGGAIGTRQTFQAEIPEVYNPATNAWTQQTTAARRLPLYPWMFLAPDGRVFNAGPNVRTGFLNLTTATINGTAPGTWTDGPEHVLGRSNAPHYTPAQSAAADFNEGNYDYCERGAGTAVMYRPGEIMIAGGTGLTGVTDKIELINLNDPSPAWLSTASMHMAFARYHVNSTLLADGSVLITGGNQRPTNNDGDAALPAELWTPPTPTNPGGIWTTMNAMAVPRLYHSTAVLLPDATVLSTGGGQGGNFIEHSTYEIFTPPYLLKGLLRPQILSAPQAVAYGQTFTISSPQAQNILNSVGGRVTLVRLSSVTHSFNMNQRFLELPPAAGAASTDISLTAPTNPNVCPPGHYMLFLIDGAGTPSLASILAISPTGCANALSLTNSVVADNGCTRTVRLTASGGGAGSYSWAVDGVPNTTSTSATLDLSVGAYSPTVQVRVEQNASCGASSTFTTYFPNCTYSSRSATSGK